MNWAKKNKMQYKHTKAYYSALGKEEILTCATALQITRVVKFIKTESRNVVARGWVKCMFKGAQTTGLCSTLLTSQWSLVEGNKHTVCFAFPWETLFIIWVTSMQNIWNCLRWKDQCIHNFIFHNIWLTNSLILIQR